MSKALKKVVCRMEVVINFELDQTFARLPYDFSFVLKKVGSCRNSLTGVNKMLIMLTLLVVCTDKVKVKALSIYHN